MAQRAESLLTINGKPLTPNRLRRSLVRLKGRAEDLHRARQVRESFLDQLDGFEIDRRHTDWFGQWLMSLCDEQSATFWLKLDGISMQAAWDARVAERRAAANKPMPAPRPKKTVVSTPNQKLLVSKRYVKPPWV